MFAWYRRNWYNLGAVMFALIAFVMGFWGHDHLDRLTIILIYSFMALLAHQFEEYRLPGGAPMIVNVAVYDEKKDYDRYPGNTLSMSIVNTIAWVIYGLAILFPQAIWLGLATMYFGFTQVLGHGIQMNVKIRSWYNPGLATAVLLHLPIGIYYINYVAQRQLATAGDYLWGIAGMIGIIALTVILPVQGLKSRTSPYALTDEEMNRFGMIGKLKARGVI